MKTAHPFLLLISALSLLLFSCQQKTPENNHTTEKVISAKSKLNNAETEQLINIIQDYYTLSKAFIEDDIANVIAATQALRHSTTTLKENLAADTLHNNYSATIEPILISIEEVANAQNNIEFKRIPFSNVSAHIYRLIKATELQGITIYQQYCPMAFNDKGAYWLSPSMIIENPYFGEKMLECGETVDTID